jgi:hypothetical protein
MPMHTHLLKSLFGKAVLAAAALGGFLFFAGAPSAQAHDRDDCRPAIRYDNYRLHEAIEHRGYYSREANYWRHERHEAYEHRWRDRDGYWHRY